MRNAQPAIRVLISESQSHEGGYVTWKYRPCQPVERHFESSPVGVNIYATCQFNFRLQREAQRSCLSQGLKIFSSSVSLRFGSYPYSGI